MQNKKRHHYVPQHYLRGFAIAPDHAELFVYERGATAARKSKIREVAFENHFYTVDAHDGLRDSNTIEDFFAETIEGPANPILEKLRVQRQIILSDNEREIVARYIACLLKRVPRSKQRIKEDIAPKAIATTREKVYAELDRIVNEHPEKHEMQGVYRQKAQDLFEEYEHQLPDTFVVNIMAHDSLRIIAALCTMTWQFLTFDTKAAFITSDNPVFFFEPMGIGGSPFSEVTFPLSSHIALWMSWRVDLAEGYIATTTQAVKEINRRTASAASRSIFFSHAADWPLTLINKQKHRLTHLE